MTPDIFIEEARMLSYDLRIGLADIRHQLSFLQTKRVIPIKIYLTGIGDSYFANLSAAEICKSLSRIHCEVVEPTYFIGYEAERIRIQRPIDHCILVAVSASGNTTSVLECVRLAQELNMQTIGITCNRESVLASLVENTILLVLKNKKKAPGIRTYQASLLMLYSFFLAISNQDKYVCPLKSIINDIDMMQVTLQEQCVDIANAIAVQKAVIFLSSGLLYGTAGYCSAKLMEGTGVIAIYKTLEAWWHGERFLYDNKIPIILLATGEDKKEVDKLIAATKELNKSITVVSSQLFEEVPQIWTTPIRNFLIAPFTYHIFVHYVAARVAQNIGRYPFQTNPANFLKGNEYSN